MQPDFRHGLLGTSVTIASRRARVVLAAAAPAGSGQLENGSRGHQSRPIPAHLASDENKNREHNENGRKGHRHHLVPPKSAMFKLTH